MWIPVGQGDKKGGNGLVAVAVSNDKGCQQAFKWAIDNLLSKNQTVVLIHVVQTTSASYTQPARNAYASEPGTALVSPHKQQLEEQTKDLFMSYHCFCSRKNVKCFDVILEDNDVVKAIAEYVSYAAIQKLVLGAPTRHGLIRFRTSSIPSGVSKGAPDFCTVYIISKGKISSVRNALRQVPFTSPLLDQILKKDSQENTQTKPQTLSDDPTKSQHHGARRSLPMKQGGYTQEPDSDISFISSSRPSTDRASFVYDFTDSGSRLSSSTEQSFFGSPLLGRKSTDLAFLHEFSSPSQTSGRSSYSISSLQMDDAETEMKRLQLELKNTMDMYSATCKEALMAKQKAMELQRHRLEEERKMEEARLAQEATLSMAGKERAKSMAVVQEFRAVKSTESEGRAGATTDSMPQVRYRRYTIEEIEKATEFFVESRKIGEGGYGPVFKCSLDHTPVAVKILRPDANQGRSQFHREIEILSCIRHPNIVLLLGACPEYGCLVYEYMAKGSLEDRLLRRGNSPAIPWQDRFRIAAEIAMGLHFLHQSKPEPIVHRDLKPGNILLDRNYVAKISDVGLARLVPAVSENVTQYHMTSAAGTFCYIDPEYQQTGMLGVKSDLYAFGIILLQLLTGKPPMGLTHHVEKSIENGTFVKILDPAVPHWPLEETLCLANLALQCAELRKKDRPDLGKIVMPELVRLRDFAEDRTDNAMFFGNTGSPASTSRTSITQDSISDTLHTNSTASYE